MPTEGRDGEKTAEGGDKGALAGVGGSAEDHQGAGHGGRGVGASLFVSYRILFNARACNRA